MSAVGESLVPGHGVLCIALQWFCVYTSNHTLYMNGIHTYMAALRIPGATSVSLTCNCKGCFEKARLIEEKNPKTKITAVLKCVACMRICLQS